MIVIIAYIILAFIAGLLGKKTRLGLWGIFVLSILLTPIITLVYLFFLKEKA